MEERKLTPGELLDEDGNLIEAGYSYLPVKWFDPNRCISRFRLKEWDYYYVGNHDYGIAFTVADNGYMSLVGCVFLDYREGFVHDRSKMGAFTMGKLKMPRDIEKGDVHVKQGKWDFSFVLEGNRRHLKVKISKYLHGQDLEADIVLTPENPHSMVIATPWEKKGHFYYNVKMNCLRAEGKFTIGVKEYPLDGSYGVLDWGRGVWTYKNTWYWSSMNDVTKDGTPIGFNLGYGFGDTSAASENMLFVGRKAYKFKDVEFVIPNNEKGKPAFSKEWKIVSSSGDIDLVFTPTLVRHSDANVGIIRSNQNQVFGTFSGTFKTDDGDIEIESMFGFAEKVYNRW